MIKAPAFGVSVMRSKGNHADVTAIRQIFVIQGTPAPASIAVEVGHAGPTETRLDRLSCKFGAFVVELISSLEQPRSRDSRKPLW
jgi:hypothetical protein